MRMKRLSLMGRGLGRLFFLSILALTLIPLSVVFWLSYQKSYDSLMQQASLSLESLLAANRSFFIQYFHEREENLLLQSDLNANVQLLQELETSLNQSRLSLPAFVTSYSHVEIVSRHDADLNALIDIYNYQDLLLIDNKGQVLLSVRGMNTQGIQVFDAQNHNTALSEVVRRTLTEGSMQASDLTRSHLTNNESLMYLCQIMVDKQGEHIGFMVLSINAATLSGVSLDTDSLGQRANAFLVGKDLMSLTSKASNNNALGSVSAQGWSNSKANDEFQQAKANIYVNGLGQRVLGQLAPLTSLEKLGLEWAMVAELDEGHAFAPVYWLKRLYQYMFVLAIIAVAFAAVYLTRKIVTPLRSLTHWATQVEQGELSLEQIAPRDDEIGALHQALTHMVLSFRQVVSQASAIAAGDLPDLVTPRSESDTLGHSLANMNQSLREIVDKADMIAAGEIHQEISPRSHQDRLGLALSKMTRKLRQLIHAHDKQHKMKTMETELYATMRGDLEQVEFCEKVLTQLAHQLQLDVAVFYITDQRQHSRFTAGYAVSEPKTKFMPGQGLVGQAVLDKRPHSLTVKPESVPHLVSEGGHIKAFPSAVMVLPLITVDEVKGVLELGKLTAFEDWQLEYLSSIAEPLAISILVTQARGEQQNLLFTTEQQKRDLQQQQEELKAANEELEEQTQALRESQDKLKQQQDELKATNEELRLKSDYLNRQNIEIEQAKAQIDKKAEELAAASRYKSEFLANMSHELRSPLNSLLILAANLANNTQNNLTQEQVESAQIIHKGGQDLLCLINDILDLSKVEAGRLDIHLERHKVEDIVAPVLEQFLPLAQQKSLALKVQYDQAIPAQIVTDALRAKQILKNLLSNAIKFTAKGAINLKVFLNENMLCFEVKDTGIGIEPKKLDEIFEAFQQGDGTTSRKYGGTGLGLTISRRLTQLLGGKLHVKSTLDKGSSFTLTLPTWTRPSSVETNPAHINLNSMAAAPTADCLLIIESDSERQKQLQAFASERGFSSQVAAQTADAIALAAAHKPIGIVINALLYDDALLAQFKRHISTRDVPIHVFEDETQWIEEHKTGIIGVSPHSLDAPSLTQAIELLDKNSTRPDKHLLLVEDDEANIERFKALVKDLPHEVDICTCGEAALTALETGHYDGMILDLGLPDISGLGVLNTASNRSLALPPTLVYTAKEISREEEEELKKHMATVIVKGPEGEKRLLKELALFLNKVKGTEEGTQRPLEGFSILIADDDMRNLFALTGVLQAKGIKVIQAENGKAALAKLANQAVDLVLIDVMMPELDGYEVTRQIKATPELAHIPVVALTAQAMPEDRKKCLEAGMDDYLSKPVDVDKLLSMLQVWLFQETQV